ncbi:MAG: hypothetical protein IT335_02150 [Thermomicrobiales bacterium]|jgi:diacylglycerol kinase|nr:hypothetical protein [Thermomicrobiales bacterium]
MPDALQTDNHILWALIATSVVMVITLEAVQSAVEGAWPHQRRPSTMLPSERTAHSLWGIVALALIAGGLLLIANLAILLWKDLDPLDIQRAGGVLLAVAWALFMLVSIDRFGIRRHMTAIGLAGPVAAIAILTAAIVLLSLALIDIWPPTDDFRDALPVILITALRRGG